MAKNIIRATLQIQLGASQFLLNNSSGQEAGQQKQDKKNINLFLSAVF